MANEYKKMFPVEIDLCKEREVPDYDKQVKEGKERPTKKVTDCPTMYIRGIEGLDQIPEDGYVLVKIHRSKLTEENRSPGVSSGNGLSYPGDSGEPKKGKTHEVELEVHEMCLPAADGEAESDDEDKDKGEFGDAMDKTAEKLGLKSKSKAPAINETADSENDEHDGY